MTILAQKLLDKRTRNITSTKHAREQKQEKARTKPMKRSWNHMILESKQLLPRMRNSLIDNCIDISSRQLVNVFSHRWETIPHRVHLLPSVDTGGLPEWTYCVMKTVVESLLLIYNEQWPGATMDNTMSPARLADFTRCLLSMQIVCLMNNICRPEEAQSSRGTTYSQAHSYTHGLFCLKTYI